MKEVYTQGRKEKQRLSKSLRVSLRLCVRIICVVCALLLTASVVSIFISPAVLPCAALFCLAFPVLFILNAAALLAALFIGRKFWLIPLAALVLSLPALRTYCPVNFGGDVPEGTDTLRVLTFNTRNFGGHESDSTGRNYVAGFMLDSRADIVCFQEGAVESEYYERYLLPLFSRYPYKEVHVKEGGTSIGVFSQWPIVETESVVRRGLNCVMAYRIVRSAGDTLRLLNCHLSSVGLSEAQREVYSQAVRGYVATDDITGGVGAIVRAFCKASSRRSVMADSVAAYIARHAGESLVVCGDFNDTPVSYAVRRVASGLTDCYRAAGNGIGRTFCRDAIVVRIDHLFCSEDWRPLRCHAVPVETYSDHYPLITTLMRCK